MSREIIVAARAGGPDPAGNFRLRQAIDKAKASGVPNDNIKRAIAKGAGNDNSDQLEELQYEGYGPGGVGVIVRALTDNRNRTAADLRAAFSKAGGNLGETGCVGWMFAEKGQIIIADPQHSLSVDDVLNVVLEAGAQDVIDQDDAWEILTAPEDFEAVFDALQKTGWPIESSELADVASTLQVIDDAETAKKVLRLLGKLDELDDVQRVSANFEIPEALMAELSAFA